MEMETLDLSAVGTCESSYVTTVTPESCAASTNLLDDVLYEHTAKNFDYVHCQNHYSSLSHTDHLQYDSLQLTASSTTSNQYQEPFNNCDVTDNSDQSVSTETIGQNRKSITSQCYTDLTLAAVEDYLTLLPDGTCVPVNRQLLICNV